MANRRAAKWGNILYEEARREIANVAVPSETIQQLFKEEAPTPGVPKAKAKLAIPSVLTGGDIPIIKAAEVTKNLLFGTREEKAETAVSFLPAAIDITSTTAPEYKSNITYETVSLPFGNVKVPTVNYGGPTYVSNTGVTTEDVTIQDYPIHTNTKSFEDYVSDLIDLSKASSQEAKNFWETQTFATTNIQIPSIGWPELPDIGGFLGDLGKYALIAIAGLGALLILTRR